MNNAVNNEIKFNKKDHTYTRDGKQLTPVTELLRKHGLAPDYSGVSEEVLAKKAERGTLIHEELEAYNKTGEVGFTKECAEWAEHVEKEQMKIVLAEQIVGNDIVAGTFDVLLNPPKGMLILGDFKTTSTLHIDSVSWQLSIYKYLLGCDSCKLQAFHFLKGGDLKVVDVPEKPKEEIERLLDCERAGTLYSQDLTAIASNAQLIALSEAVRAVEEAEAAKKEAEAVAAEIKAKILEAMEKTATKTIETDTLRITYVLPSERKTLDSARLKKDHPELAEEYSKTTQTAASLRVTLR